MLKVQWLNLFAKFSVTERTAVKHLTGGYLSQWTSRVKVMSTSQQYRHFTYHVLSLKTDSCVSMTSAHWQLFPVLQLHGMCYVSKQIKKVIDETRHTWSDTTTELACDCLCRPFWFSWTLLNCIGQITVTDFSGRLWTTSTLRNTLISCKAQVYCIIFWHLSL